MVNSLMSYTRFGVWACSTGKRFKITEEVQVAVKASELDESFWKNIVKEETSPQSEQKSATKLCPPGMWVCDEINKN
ncbi:hypothetical protein ACROYT_G002004 [Oculina patagonica]